MARLVCLIELEIEALAEALLPVMDEEYGVTDDGKIDDNPHDKALTVHVLKAMQDYCFKRSGGLGWQVEVVTFLGTREG